MRILNDVDNLNLVPDTTKKRGIGSHHQVLCTYLCRPRDATHGVQRHRPTRRKPPLTSRCCTRCSTRRGKHWLRPPSSWLRVWRNDWRSRSMDFGSDPRRQNHCPRNEQGTPHCIAATLCLLPPACRQRLWKPRPAAFRRRSCPVVGSLSSLSARALCKSQPRAMTMWPLS